MLESNNVYWSRTKETNTQTTHNFVKHTQYLACLQLCILRPVRGCEKSKVSDYRTL